MKRAKSGSDGQSQKSGPQLNQLNPSLTQIAENIPDMIFEFHQEKEGPGKFTYVSNAVREIYELAPEDLLQDPTLAWSVIHPEDEGNFKNYLRQKSAPRELVYWEGRLILKDSFRLKWIKISARPEEMSDGTTKWHGVVSDITKLKNIEKQLIYAREKAEQEAKAKEDFLATMSHEIRTPLSGIVGMTELLAMDAPPEQEEKMKLLQFSSNNLMLLINNILDISKLNAGKMIVSEDKMRLRSVLENLQKIHSFKASENRTELILKIDPSIPEVVLADEMVFMQIMNNLIGNALKFTKDGSVEVQLETRRWANERVYLQVSVKDTGIGITEKNIQKIFNEFEQAGKRQTGSTGLGLAICKKLINLLGGKLYVNSTPGKGSNFHFNLSFGIDEHPQNNIEVPQTSPMLSKSITLLLVDDVEDNRMMLRSFFQKWGNIALDEACNGAEALKLMESHNYDMVFMDLRMPEMDGWETCKRIRKSSDESIRNTPVIAITADTFSKKDTSNFSSVLIKPFTPQQILDKIVHISSAENLFTGSSDGLGQVSA